MRENNTESLILAAAEEEFLAKGFDGARTTSIAQRAGVTHAMLHYYFRTKEALFERIMDEKFAWVVQSLIESFEQSEENSFVSRITCAVRAHFDFLVRQPQLPLFVLNEVIRRPERLEAARAIFARRVVPFVAACAAQLREAVEKGEVVEMDFFTLLFDMAALNVFSVVAGQMMAPLSGHGEADFLTLRREENVLLIKKRLCP